MAEKMFNVGKIVNTHGIRGDVKVLAQTDFPEERFAKGSELLAVHPEDPSKQKMFTVESAREQKGLYYIKFNGITNINEIEPFKGWELKITEDQLIELEEDEFYYHEIVGCEVYSEEGELLGKVKEILTPGANDVWVVGRPKGKDLLIPYINDVVLDVNIEEKKVKVHLMEGLI
ncbi:ribosome maturation factor RimM [Paenibacillus turpanensis]|uniref:ribosome maturation factor RimM n=1 Tax=Paenibacillus turpanensis TaxID=2689078 RepID=UPI00140CEB28|nr:ribosome maturation factor RimM [Paenibacillus turpanensis]